MQLFSALRNTAVAPANVVRVPLPPPCNMPGYKEATPPYSPATEDDVMAMLNFTTPRAQILDQVDSRRNSPPGGYDACGPHMPGRGAGASTPKPTVWQRITAFFGGTDRVAPEGPVHRPGKISSFLPNLLTRVAHLGSRPAAPEAAHSAPQTSSSRLP